MKCEDRKDLLMEFALGHLDPSAEAELRSHFDGGCEVCTRELAEISAAWASLAVDLDPVEVPPSVEKGIMSRIRAEENKSATTPTSEAPVVPARAEERSSHRSIMPYVIAASLLGVVTAALCWRFLPNGLEVARSSSDSTNLETWGDAALDPHSPGFRTVGLKPLDSKSGITLSIVRNEAVKQWHVLISGLPNSTSGSILQLWAELKSGDFARLATLSTNGAGTASTLVDLPKGASDYAGLWLTVEKDTSTERPEGNVLFRGMID